MQQINSQLILILCRLFGNCIGLIHDQAEGCIYQLSNSAIPFSNDGYVSKADNLVQEVHTLLSVDIENIDGGPRKDYKLAYEQGFKYLTDLIKADFFLFEESLETEIQKLVDKIEAANDIARGEKMVLLFQVLLMPMESMLRIRSVW